MSISRKIQSDRDKINFLLAKGELTDDELHDLNDLYNDLQYYLDHYVEEEEE